METIKITQLEQAVLQDLANGFAYKSIMQAHNLSHSAYFQMRKSLLSPTRFDARNSSHLAIKYRELKALGKIEVLEEVATDAS